MIRKVKELIPGKFKRTAKRTFRSLLESTKYWLIKPGSDKKQFRHIVFVCQGNICRSVFAEYYLRAHVSDESTKIESCGLDVVKAGSSPQLAVQVGRDFGLDLGSHLSKSYLVCDIQKADLIVPMEYPQYRKLIEMYPDYKHKIQLLRDFSPWPEKLMCNIYDPYGLEETDFRQCFGHMKKALERLSKIAINHGE